jgi:hypothetical protein
MARSPRAEMTVGAEAVLFSWLWRIRPLDDLVLGLVYRYYLSGRAPAGRRSAVGADRRRHARRAAHRPAEPVGAGAPPAAVAARALTGPRGRRHP